MWRLSGGEPLHAKFELHFLSHSLVECLHDWSYDPTLRRLKPLWSPSPTVVEQKVFRRPPSAPHGESSARRAGERFDTQKSFMAPISYPQEVEQVANEIGAHPDRVEVEGSCERRRSQVLGEPDDISANIRHFCLTGGVQARAELTVKPICSAAPIAFVSFL